MLFFVTSLITGLVLVTAATFIGCFETRMTTIHFLSWKKDDVLTEAATIFGTLIPACVSLGYYAHFIIDKEYSIALAAMYTLYWTIFAASVLPTSIGILAFISWMFSKARDLVDGLMDYSNHLQGK